MGRDAGLVRERGSASGSREFVALGLSRETLGKNGKPATQSNGRVVGDQAPTRATVKPS